MVNDAGSAVLPSLLSSVRFFSCAIMLSIKYLILWRRMLHLIIIEN